MESNSNGSKYLLVDRSVVPEVFLKVVLAKQLLAQGKAASASQAAQLAGISRSAFYKYKDYVHRYDEHLHGGVTTINAQLEDRPGVLSSLLTRLYEEGTNIITVNQNIPSDGAALVSVSVKLGKGVSAEDVSERVAALDGVIRVTNL